MAWIFTDTTDRLVYGLLSNDFIWMDYADEPIKKSSNQLHFLINNLLDKHNLSMSSVNGLLFVAGPGSYTGMRVSEGMAQIFEWQNIPVYSFYHFEVPHMMGVSDGIWFSRAFKGEYFFYDWSEAYEGEKKLIAEDDFEINIKRHSSRNLFANSRVASDTISLLISDLKFTDEIILKNSTQLFPYVVSSKMRCSPLYYRSEDQEFSKKK